MFLKSNGFEIMSKWKCIYRIFIHFFEVKYLDQHGPWPQPLHNSSHV
jgi:hypothetical protein